MIKLQNVSKEYEKKIKALRDINIEIKDGEFVFVVGPSGSGKSTITKMLTAEIRPTSGKVEVNGYDIGSIRQRDIPYLRRTLGVVFQDFRLIEDKSVYENVAFVMRAVGAPPRTIKKRVTYVLDLVGILHKARKKPRELSGGEQQRVAIARALVNDPDAIIADEPTGNLDPARSLELMLLLEKINERGTTVVVVTHDHEIVDQFSRRVIAIDGGKVISDCEGGYFQDPDARRLNEAAWERAKTSHFRRQTQDRKSGVRVTEDDTGFLPLRYSDEPDEADFQPEAPMEAPQPAVPQPEPAPMRSRSVEQDLDELLRFDDEEARR